MTNKPASLRNPNLWIILGAALFGVLLSWVLIHNAEQQRFSELDQSGNERLNLYASTVEAAHKRFDYLPFIVAGDHQVQRLFDQPQNTTLADAVNRKLESWKNESNAADLYLMDRTGVVIAASNWQQKDSFIGNDYHFRPYFQSAINGLPGQFFAVGVTTARPGLFLSREVRDGDEIIGVAVIKIDMTQLESDWAAGGENVWITDTDGVIFLSSNPAWRYKSLTQLSKETLTRLDSERKYSHHPIQPLQLIKHSPSPEGNAVITLKTKAVGSPQLNQNFLLHQRQIEGLNWQLYYLSDLQGLARSKQVATLVAVLIAALLAVIGLFLSSRWKHQQLLELRVAQRTRELNQSNAQLKQEIEERIRAEKALRQTHEELIQAEKLAALGQLSAGLVHEISQPLSAIQTFLASTQLLIERDEIALARENLTDIDKLIRRVTSIVSHLKTFASKSRGVLSRVQLQQVVDNALLVLTPRFNKTDIRLNWQPPSEPIEVHADEIKLEQILVNLIRNAIDATQEEDEITGEITIELRADGKQAQISIRDNGCGIEAEDLPKLFDPFFTTKPPGEGLGLGLSVSFGIVEEFGGKLDAEPNPDRGTTFNLTLSLAQPEPNHVG
ncbi:MAG: sensor histidine kinase [Neptuniibacter sp.]